MKADAIIEDEEDHLWNSGVLGNNKKPPDHDTGLENCERFCNKRYCIH